MEVKLNAIVTRAIDYKDNDKILTLYSLEKGRLSANIKGVKKPKAKLKFASEPFCFAEFILAEKLGKYTVINASYKNSFYNLRLNLTKYYLSAVVTDVINNLIEDGISDAFLFVDIIQTINCICFDANEKTTLAVFLYKLADYLGYGFNDTDCSSCGETINGRVFFNYQDATFACEECRGQNYSEITLDTYQALNAIIPLTLKNAFTVEIEEVKINKLLKFLLHYLTVKTDVKLKSAAALNEFLSGEKHGL